MDGGPLGIPNTLSFSYGRALQHSARVVWKGKAENVAAAQAALVDRARMNSEASLGTMDAAKRRKLNGGEADVSLHVV